MALGIITNYYKGGTTLNYKRRTTPCYKGGTSVYFIAGTSIDYNDGMPVVCAVRFMYFLCYVMYHTSEQHFQVDKNK